MMNREITIRARTKTELNMRIKDSMSRGMLLKSQGKHREPAGYTVFWAKLLTQVEDKS